jgi:hypothetical protein
LRALVKSFEPKRHRRLSTRCNPSRSASTAFQNQ